MSEFIFSVSHSITTDHTIDLPCTSWEDVAEFYVKWNTLHVKLKDRPDWMEIDLGDIDLEDLDVKHPARVDVFDPETYQRLFDE